MRTDQTETSETLRDAELRRLGPPTRAVQALGGREVLLAGRRVA